MRERAEEMRAQIDRIREMVEEQRFASASKVSTELSVKLVALTEHDDIESNLVTFERIMAAHKVDVQGSLASLSYSPVDGTWNGLACKGRHEVLQKACITCDHRCTG